MMSQAILHHGPLKSMSDHLNISVFGAESYSVLKMSQNRLEDPAFEKCSKGGH